MLVLGRHAYNTCHRVCHYTPIAFCSFVVGFIINDLKKKRVTLSGTMAIISHGQTMNVIKQNDGIARWRHYNAVIYWMSKEF